VHQTYFSADTLKELFENVDSENIIAFVNDINFCHHVVVILYCLYSTYFSKHFIIPN